MVQARLRPSHRIRQASGPTRPAPLTVRKYWTFDPQPAKEVFLRYRSAPWDDILDDELSEQDTVDASDEDEVASVTSNESLQVQSPTGNIIGRPPPPTHYKSLAVQPAQPRIGLLDQVAQGILAQGVHLPPPANAPAVFHTTQVSQLMDRVITDLLQQRILQHSGIVNAFRLFLIAKADGATRPILDLSPWTPYYHTPPMRLYSAAEVLVAIPQTVGSKIRILSDCDTTSA
jgi:hypothetical protein